MSKGIKVPTVGLGSAHAPALLLPLRFVLAGLVALALGVAGLVAYPETLATYHYNQHVIALTHLFVLGWILTVVMGSVYQLVPVALETRLYSERLARWQFVFQVVGAGGMVWMFWIWNMKQVGHFGTILTTGVFLFVYNIARTLWRVPRWNVVSAAVALALGWLSCVVLAGLTIVAGKCSYDESLGQPHGMVVSGLFHGLQATGQLALRFDALGAMHAHAHLGVAGVFLMLLVGVSYKLVPMFTLSELQRPARAALSLVLLNGGLGGVFLAVLTRSPARPVWALIMMAGLVCYGWEIVAILRARKRRSLDWGVKYFLSALALLVPVCVLGMVLSWPGLAMNAFNGQLENLYGFLALLGVISFAIVGMFYKIIPFLVWYGSYSSRIGRQRVPALGELYSVRLQVAGYGFYLAGLLGVSAGILTMSRAVVRGGAGLLAVSLLTVLVNVAQMLRHLMWPQVKPQGPRSASGTELVPQPVRVS